jgi:ParB family chromosome partitioning protein
LRVLAANGYTLSAVEEVVTGTKTSDEVYDEYLAETGKE